MSYLTLKALIKSSPLRLIISILPYFIQIPKQRSSKNPRAKAKILTFRKLKRLKNIRGFQRFYPLISVSGYLNKRIIAITI
jgi:hypothetical protein